MSKVGTVCVLVTPGVFCFHLPQFVETGTVSTNEKNKNAPCEVRR
ncbi:Unknown protein sequence [Pseudomonas syringae pv. maculicola]|nr:Unknown protein sequence [Pseudomonas syringae pv. maculicola]